MITIKTNFENKILKIKYFKVKNEKDKSNDK